MALVMAFIDQESDFRADLISGTDDYGIMQINACNHDKMREMFGITDFLDPYQNVQCGIYIIGTHLQATEGDVGLALMRYNNGATGARRLWEEGVYSTKYSRSVMELYSKYQEEYDAYK
jgi:soluble lytic murein transglycosylase-like protein